MWEKKTQRWRKKSKRAVSPIIATILLVAITVVLAAVLYVLISGLTHGPGNTPLGTALALGVPAISTLGATTLPAGITCSTTSPAQCYTYAFTIEQAGGGITWNGVNFVVKSTSGAVASVAGYGVWTINGPSAAANLVASSAGASETAWTSGAAGSGATGISTTQTFIVYFQGTTSNSDPLSGQVLFALGVGTFSGTVQVNIP